MKITATMSKTVESSRRKCSSQSFGGSVELDISEDATEEEITEQVSRAYRILEPSIDAEVKARTRTSNPGKKVSAGRKGRGVGKEDNSGITPSQAKVITNFAQSFGWPPDELKEFLKTEYEVEKLHDLATEDADQIIGDFREKRRQTQTSVLLI